MQKHQIYTTITIIILTVLLTVISFAKRGDYNGVNTGVFTQIPVSARALGMGTAFSAVADDTAALEYNPAGLTYLRKLGISLQYQDWIADTSIQYMAITHPMPRHATAAFAVRHFGSKPFNNYNEWGETIGHLHYEAFSVTGAYARRFNERHDFGLTTRILSQNISADPFNINGKSYSTDGKALYTIAFDAGWKYRINPFKINFMGKMRTINNLYISGVLKNIGGGIKGEKQRSMIVFGALYPILPTLKVSLDFNKPVYRWHSLADGDYRVNTGIEYTWREIIYGRAGFRLASNDPNFIVLGAGLRHAWSTYELTIDYTVMPYGSLFNGHQISVGLKMNGLVKTDLTEKELRMVRYYYQKAMIYYIRDDINGAAAYIDKVLDIDPHNSKALMRKEEIDAIQELWERTGVQQTKLDNDGTPASFPDMSEDTSPDPSMKYRKTKKARKNNKKGNTSSSSENTE